MRSELRKLASADLPTKYGPARIHVFDSRPAGDGEIVVLAHGAAADGLRSTPLVRLHSVCLTGDVFGSLNCDCGPQLERSMDLIMAAPHGILVYVRNHEGRGIGLASKIRAITLQAEQGFDTIDANLALGLPVDARDFRQCAEALRQLGVTRIRLLTNNPDKVRSVTDAGIEVVERVPLAGFSNPHNERYLGTKRDLLGHLLQPTPPAAGAASVPVMPASHSCPQ